MTRSGDFFDILFYVILKTDYTVEMKNVLALNTFFLLIGTEVIELWGEMPIGRKS